MKTEWIDESSSIGVLYDDSKAKLVVDLIVRRIYDGANAYAEAVRDGIDFAAKRKVDKSVWFK